MDEELRSATEVCSCLVAVFVRVPILKFVSQEYRLRLQVLQQQSQSKSPPPPSTFGSDTSVETANKVAAMEKALEIARQREEKLRKRQTDLESVVQVLSLKYEKVSIEQCLSVFDCYLQ